MIRGRAEKSLAEKVWALKDLYGEFKTGAALETSQDFVPYDHLFLICTGKNTRRPQRLLAEDNLFVFLNELHLRDEWFNDIFAWHIGIFLWKFYGQSQKFICDVNEIIRDEIVTEIVFKEAVGCWSSMSFSNLDSGLSRGHWIDIDMIVFVGEFVRGQLCFEFMTSTFI